MPADLPAGEYVLSLAIVAGNTTTPVVRLAIKGRTGDGWYPVSKIRVGRSLRDPG